MGQPEVVGESVLDAGLDALEARAVVLGRIRMGADRPIGHVEADELLELLGDTPRREGARQSLLGHADAVLWRWYWSVGTFLPRSGMNPGASRVVPDRVRLLGWLGDVRCMVQAADGPQCPGGSGALVLDAIDAQAERDYLRNAGRSAAEVGLWAARARNLRRRLACKIARAWLACLPRMQRL